MTVNPGDPTPAYAQIANYLRSQIQRGLLRDGDQLPSQRDLVEETGSAAGTVQRAIGQLESEGLVVKIQGRGTYVRHPRRMIRDGSGRHLPDKRPPATGPLESEAASQGFTREQRVLAAGRMGAPAAVAERFGVPDGDVLFGREITILLNPGNQPIQTVASYFRPALADDPVLQLPREVPGGTHEYLRRQLGIPISYAVEDSVARMPTPQEFMDLRLVPGTPVVEMIRTIYTQTDEPVEVSVFVFAADRHEFRYRVPMA